MTFYINIYKQIADIIGKDNIYIRYDPIFLSEKYNLNYHIKAFERLCSLLDGCTNHIIISCTFQGKMQNPQNLLH